MNDLTVCILQADLHWENSGANLDHFSEMIRSLSDPAEVIVLPEMFNTGFSMNVQKLAQPMNGPALSWMKDEAEKNKVILAGSLMIQEDDNYFNRFVWMLPNGNYGFYDKRHLFAYAQEHSFFSRGKKRLITSVKGWRANLQVCYDLRFPVWARQQAGVSQEESSEYDLLIYVANWPEARLAAWSTLLQARAIENQCYVIGVNRVGTDGNGIRYPGNSMAVDPLGNILYQGSDKEETHTTMLKKSSLLEARDRYPFLCDRDFFVINS